MHWQQWVALLLQMLQNYRSESLHTGANTKKIFIVHATEDKWPSVNTLIARYTHHTFSPIIKHLITTTANKHPGKKSFIDKKNMRKSHWHQAVHIT